MATKVEEIDMNQSEDVVLDKMRNAYTSTGFTILRNHGISQELMDAALANCEALFSLPQEKKESLKSEVPCTGYQPMGGIKVDAQSAEQPGNWREGFYACKGVPWVPKTEPEDWPDQWPSKARYNRQVSVLKELLPGFAPVAAEFCKEAMRLTLRVARLLSKILGEPESWMETSYLQDPFVDLHNLHYPPVKSQPEKGILGLGAHSDFGFYTLLLCKEPGLQMLVDGQWQDLNPGYGSIIVNLGDELRRITNGKFASQVRRVISYGKDRHSVAFFVNADYDAVLECLPSCCRDTPAKYQPIKSSDFLAETFNAVHQD